jgi:transcriptional regulator with XRE-family HTH domain
MARLRQDMLGRKLGLTAQTIGRWEKGTRGPTKNALRHLVAIFYPIDRAATAALVEARGLTLQQLGVPGLTVPATAVVSLRHAVDVILLAGAEASDTPAANVRAIVRAAVKRAREMGFSLDAIERGLEPEQA